MLFSFFNPFNLGADQCIIQKRDHTSVNFKLGGSSLAILTGNELKMSLIPPEHKLSEYILGKFNSMFFIFIFLPQVSICDRGQSSDGVIWHVQTRTGPDNHKMMFDDCNDVI